MSAHDLVAMLAANRVVDETFRGTGGEKVVVVVELHPDYVATDEPAAVWVFAKHGELTEAGVLLAFSDGHVEIGREFSSL